MEKNILLTGGSGFIGQKVLERINRNEYNVHILSRHNSSDIYKKDKWHNIDLGNLEETYNLVKKIRATHLVHLAWDVKNQDFANSMDNISWITKSINILNAFVEAGGKNFVGAGTCFEYDFSIDNPLSEKSFCCPNTIYGKCKLETKKLASSICESNGVRFVWGRIFYPYGLGEEQRKLFSTIISTFKENKTFVCRNPEDIIDYISVDDVAKYFEQFIVDKNLTGVINVCTGKGIIIKEILEFIKKEMQSKSEIIYEKSISKKIIGSSIIQLRIPTVMEDELKKMIRMGDHYA